VKLPNLSEAHLMPASWFDSGSGVLAEHSPRPESAPTCCPSVSIITPSYNRVEFIEEAIRSVLSQEYPNLEYMVIDGGSTDGTLEILRKYPQVRVISEPDEGVYAALNKGIRQAHGEIIGLLNSDDLYEAGVIWEVAGRFRKDPALDLVSGGAVAFEEDASGNRGEIARYTDEKQIHLLLVNVVFGPPIMNARFFRRRVYQNIGLFDTRFSIAADREFLLRVALAQLEEDFIDRTVYAYRVHPGSLTLNRARSNAMQTYSEHLAIAELYLRARDISRTARVTLRSWHSHETLAAGWMELLKGRPLRTVSYALRGWRYDPVWPFVSWFYAARKVFRQLGRRLRRGGRLHPPNCRKSQTECADGSKPASRLGR